MSILSVGKDLGNEVEQEQDLSLFLCLKMRSNVEVLDWGGYRILETGV